MSEYILANIDFSHHKPLSPLEQKLALQLSALSFCLGTKDDKATVCFTPDQAYLDHIHSLDLPVTDYILWDALSENTLLNPWMKTNALLKACEEKKIPIKYPFSDIEIKTASKAFAFALSPPPFKAKLIDSKQELLEFLNEQEGLFVLKKPLDQSGRGHYFINAGKNISSHSIPDINYQGVRVEKWVKRHLDFSSQWLLDDKIALLGLCEIINNHKGGYKGSKFPLINPQYEHFFDQHIQQVTPIIQTLHKQGYRGHLGVDAFIFEQDNQLDLCPLIELNPRKTMGFVALNLSLHFKKPCHITLSRSQSGMMLLPTKIKTKQGLYTFKTNLELRFC